MLGLGTAERLIDSDRASPGLLLGLIPSAKGLLIVEIGVRLNLVELNRHVVCYELKDLVLSEVDLGLVLIAVGLLKRQRLLPSIRAA